MTARLVEEKRVWIPPLETDEGLPITRMGTIPDKQHAHELIERLPDSQIATAVRFLESILLDPVTHTVDTAPLDDEPVSEQDRLRFHDGQAWFRQQGGK